MFDNRLYPPEEKIVTCSQPHCFEPAIHFYDKELGFCDKHALKNGWTECSRCKAIIKETESWAVNGEDICDACYFTVKEDV